MHNRAFPCGPPEWAAPQQTHEQRLAVLFSLGHFMDLVESFDDHAWSITRRVAHSDTEAYKRAVASYQMFSRDSRGPLKVDTEYGPWTQSALKYRFCGCPDRTPTFDVLKHRFGGGQPKWTGGPIMVWTDARLGAINPDSYVAAGQWWSTVCGVQIGKASSKSQADIWAAAAYIDGASNTLAWSYSPDRSQRVRSAGGTRQLEQRYDTGDNSIYADAASAREIMAHELGHALHFDGHTTNTSDIMYPSFSGAKGKFGTNEVRFMVEAYGPPGPTTPPPGPPGEEGQITLVWQGRLYSGVLRPKTGLAPLLLDDPDIQIIEP